MIVAKHCSRAAASMLGIVLRQCQSAALIASSTILLFELGVSQGQECLEMLITFNSLEICRYRRYFDTNWNFGVGALWFYALEETLDGVVLVDNMTIDSAPFEAIQFFSDNSSNVITNVSISNSHVVGGVGTFVVQIQSAGGASFTNVTVRDIDRQLSKVLFSVAS